MGASHQALLMIGAAAGGFNPDISLVKILLHGDGTDGANVSSTEDVRGHLLVNGAGLVDYDTAQSVFGGSSMLFTGAGDSQPGVNQSMLQMQSSTDFNAGTSDFALELRIRLNALPSVTGFVWDGRTNSADGAHMTLYVSSAGVLIYHANSATRITGQTLSTGVWYGLCVSRVGTSTRLFVDGMQSGSTYSDSTNYTGALPCIGATLAPFDPKYGINGWIDELRLTIGEGISANYTLRTSAFPDS